MRLLKLPMLAVYNFDRFLLFELCCMPDPLTSLTENFARAELLLKLSEKYMEKCVSKQKNTYLCRLLLTRLIWPHKSLKITVRPCLFSLWLSKKSGTCVESLRLSTAFLRSMDFWLRKSLEQGARRKGVGKRGESLKTLCWISCKEYWTLISPVKMRWVLGSQC